MVCVFDSFRQQGNMLPGDVLLVTAFISYVGCFTKQFRLDLLNKMWLPNLEKLEVSYWISNYLGKYERIMQSTLFKITWNRLKSINILEKLMENLRYRICLYVLSFFLLLFHISWYFWLFFHVFFILTFIYSAFNFYVLLIEFNH